MNKPMTLIMACSGKRNLAINFCSRKLIFVYNFAVRELNYEIHKTKKNIVGTCQYLLLTNVA